MLVYFFKYNVTLFSPSLTQCRAITYRFRISAHVLKSSQHLIHQIIRHQIRRPAQNTQHYERPGLQCGVVGKRGCRSKPKFCSKNLDLKMGGKKTSKSKKINNKILKTYAIHRECQAVKTALP
jgi:hypothetical protein